MLPEALRVLIVDDEAPSRRKLLRLLSSDPEVAVVGEAGNGESAVEAIHALRPDLVFLDVQMPDRDGFAVLAEVPAEVRPHIIFVTAHDQYALPAFEVHALDYLLKPVQPSRFAESLARAKGQIRRGRDRELHDKLDRLLAERAAEPTAIATRLLVQAEGKLVFVPVAEIEWAEAARNYVCLHAAGATHVFRGTLDGLLRQLDPQGFARINRSQAVSLDCVRELQPWFHGDQRVLLRDGTQLTWSRRYLPALPTPLGRRT